MFDVSARIKALRSGFASLAFLTCAALSSTVGAQSVAGTWSPTSTTASQPVTLTLAYTGFTTKNLGYRFRVYFNSAQLSFVSAASTTAPASAYQGDTGVLADGGNADADALTDNYVELIWADLGNAWPTNPSGTLGTVSFTTTAGFTGTSSNLREAATGSLVRNVPGSAAALPFFVPATSATFTAAPASLTFAEGGAAQSIAVTCAGTIGNPTPVVINVASSNLPAFTVAPASLSFTTCPSSQNVTVTPRPADAVSNPTQTGNVTFSTATTGATAPASVGVTVTDNQTPAVYTITKASATVTEGSAATDTIVITCTGTLSTTPGSVSYAIAGITSGTDYTATPASPVSFPACGGATQAITISPRVNDAIVQGNRTGTLTISTPVGGTIGGSGTASIAVNDDDTPQTVTVAVTGSPATEAGGVLTYTFTRAGGNPAAVAATLAVNITPPVASSRYSTTCAATVTFAASATTATCSATGIDNVVIDGNVNVLVAIAAPTVAGSYTVGTPASATGVIADDDTPQTVTVAVTGSPATESGGVLTYTFTRVGGNAAAVAATLAVNVTPPAASGRYSTTCTSTVTFAAAATTATCTATGISNAVVDGNVNVIVTVAAPTVAGSYVIGSPASATGVIADDDFAVTVTAASSAVTEGQNALFTISCNGATGTYTANYTITGRDPASTATPSATTAPLVCTTGASTATVTVSTTDDVIIGNGRSVTLTLTSVVAAVPGAGSVVVGTPASATVSVVDNDQPLIVPTMGLLGLGMMSLMLAGLAGFQQRRRRTLK